MDIFLLVAKALSSASPIQLGIWALAASGSAVGIAVGITRLCTALMGYRHLKEAERLQKRMVWSEKVYDFTADELRKGVRHYIVPDCAQVDPSNSRDLRKVPVVRESVMAAIQRFIEESEDHKHLLILADTGMGKTTFCLNFFAAQNAKRKKGYSCAVIPLGRPNALEKIRKVPNPTDTVLLLDAFDEDVKAIEDAGSRIHELMSAASEFRTVVMTCRSQFFRDDASIPTRTGVKFIGPRKAGKRGEYRFQTLYLLPFDAKQIDLYIRTQFKWWEWRGLYRRARARKLVADIRELSVRPMLLELVPDLLRANKRISELFELYKFMTDSWVQREEDWISPTILLAVSKRLATFIYTSRQHRIADRVTLEELHTIARALNVPEDSWKHLSARSLLNRDSEGNFKFSHRSIMEYFFVVAAIEGEESCFGVFWSDFMRDLFVSWGNTSQGRSNISRALDILSLDLKKLGLSPLVSPLPSARAVSVQSYTQRTEPLRRIPQEWRAKSVRLRPGEEGISQLLEDHEYGLIWEVSQLARFEDFDLMKMTYVELSKTVMLERLPSKEQFLSLIEAQAALGINLLPSDTLLWLGDRIGKRNLAMASLSNEALVVDGVKAIGRLDVGGESVWLYQVANNPMSFGAHAPRPAAVPLMVEEVDLESFRSFHSMTHEQVQEYLGELSSDSREAQLVT